jgi:hypothetical protein
VVGTCCSQQIDDFIDEIHDPAEIAGFDNVSSPSSAFAFDKAFAANFPGQFFCSFLFFSGAALPTSLAGTPIRLTAVFLLHFGSLRAPILSEYIRTSHLPIGFRYYFINWTQTNQTDPPNLAPPPA